MLKKNFLAPKMHILARKHAPWFRVLGCGPLEEPGKKQNKHFDAQFRAISHFPIDLRRRPYNALALPCECVIS